MNGKDLSQPRSGVRWSPCPPQPWRCWPRRPGSRATPMSSPASGCPLVNLHKAWRRLRAKADLPDEATRPEALVRFRRGRGWPGTSHHRGPARPQPAGHHAPLRPSGGRAAQAGRRRDRWQDRQGAQGQAEGGGHEAEDSDMSHLKSRSVTSSQALPAERIERCKRHSVSSKGLCERMVAWDRAVHGSPPKAKASPRPLLSQEGLSAQAGTFWCGVSPVSREMPGNRTRGQDWVASRALAS
jgi:hypothetical protein